MIQGIDHIVIAGTDLDVLTEQFRDIGFTVVDGGRHPIGSYNRLIGLQDGSYIELLSFYEDSPEHYWWDAVHKHGGGLIDFCVQTDDIHGDFQRFKDLGVEMNELTGLSRKRPDGYELSWTNSITRGRYQGLIPFMIEDITSREERVPKENQHANQVTGIDTITLVPDGLDLPTSIMGRVLGQTGTRFSVGPHTIAYVPLHDGPQISFKTSGDKQTLNVAGVKIAFV